MVLNVVALLNLVLATQAVLLPSVSINKKKLKLSQSHNNSLIMANTTYEFRENEMVNVKCDVSDLGITTFKVKDEPEFPVYIDTRSINMYMRMRPERDGKYIDCHHNVSGVESIVRIMLKRQPISTNKGAERPDDEEIRYGLTQWSGIQGLNFSRILFFYYPFNVYQEVHYEYKDQECLDVMWNVSLIASMSNEYTVYWKDKLVSSLPVIRTEYNCRVSLKFKPIILAAEDDRSIIRYGKTINDDHRSSHDELRIILRRISDTKGMEQETLGIQNFIQLSIFIPVGILCFLIVILITVICFIVKRKTKISRSVTNDPSYGDLESEESVNPFPSQWETYANVMERRYPDANSMGRLYATPLPKSQRKGHQKDTYVNSNVTAAPAAEGLYSVVDRCSAQEHAPRIQ